jgi:hypothetical protein
LKSLDITLGGITTSIAVLSDAPPRWARAGGDPHKPADVIRTLFAEARAEGIAETSIMAPRLKLYEDGVQVEPPIAVRAWLSLSR